MNYGPGGTVQGHLDTVATDLHFYQDDKRTHLLSQTGGERIMTGMVYLSDVEVGGNTVFPQIGVAVKPQVRIKDLTLFMASYIYALERFCSALDEH